MEKTGFCFLENIHEMSSSREFPKKEWLFSITSTVKGSCDKRLSLSSPVCSVLPEHPRDLRRIRRRRQRQHQQDARFHRLKVVAADA